MERIPRLGLANRPLADLPELRALATRISVMRLEVTDAELVAKMRDLAAKGYTVKGKNLLEPGKCREVCEFVISECRGACCPPNLRLIYNSYLDYILWESDHAACDWRDLVANRVREATHHFRAAPTTMSREERRRWRRNIVREILRLTDVTAQQERLYEEKTNKSRSDFHRRKREVESGEFGEGE